MHRRTLLLSLLAVGLAGCDAVGVPGAVNAPKGTYVITARQKPRVEQRVLEDVNTRRTIAGLVPLVYNDALTAAAVAHSQDMSAQNRPWHWGADGSSPIDRVRRQGYAGNFQGETISESYQDELMTIDAWMNEADTRAVIMDPAARDLGFGWYQEPNGKLWWTLITGVPFESAPLVL